MRRDLHILADLFPSILNALSDIGTHFLGDNRQLLSGTKVLHTYVSNFHICVPRGDLCNYIHDFIHIWVNLLLTTRGPKYI